MVNNKKITGFFLLVSILIISFLILLFQRKITKQQSAKPSSQQPTSQASFSPTPKEKVINLPQSTKGQLILEYENNLPINVSQNFNLILKADIPQEDIVGFDVVFSYDSQALEFVSASSLKEEFTLIPVKKENYLRLTLAKKPSFTQPTFFSQTPVVRLTFKAKKKGLSIISVLSKMGNEKTQFINNKTEIIYPATAQIKIDVL